MSIMPIVPGHLLDAPPGRAPERPVGAPERPVHVVPDPAPGQDDARLSAFCRDTFASLARSDQRRCAQAYVRGLLYGTGRRSSRRIATELAGSYSGQALQQFVNQSPWDPSPVRTRLAGRAYELAGSGAGPAAWILDEVAFPKNGRCSAAVERQFVPTLGKMVNAQLAVAISLTTPDLSIPLDWRLSMPASWDDDAHRRARSHVPAHERHRPYWEYLVDLVDAMTIDRGFAPAPIVADLSQTPDASDLVHALQARDVDYLVQVGPRQPVRAALRGPAASPGTADSLALADLTAWAGRRVERQTVAWRSGAGDLRLPRSQWLTVPVRLAATDRADGAFRGPLLALLEWPLGSPRPRGFWLTNLADTPVHDLVRLAKLGWRSRLSLTELAERFGLCDYEGRSFPGWHHHVTLSTAAYAYQLGVSISGRDPR